MSRDRFNVFSTELFPVAFVTTRETYLERERKWDDYTPEVAELRWFRDSRELDVDEVSNYLDAFEKFMDARSKFSEYLLSEQGQSND